MFQQLIKVLENERTILLIVLHISLSITKATNMKINVQTKM